MLNLLATTRSQTCQIRLHRLVTLTRPQQPKTAQMARFALVAHLYLSSAHPEHICPRQALLQPSHATRALHSTIAQNGGSLVLAREIRTKTTSAPQAIFAWEVQFTRLSVMTSRLSSVQLDTSATQAMPTAMVSQVNCAQSTSTSRSRARVSASLALLATAVLLWVRSIPPLAREVTTAPCQRRLLIRPWRL